MGWVTGTPKSSLLCGSDSNWLGRGMCAHLPLPVFDHVLPTVSGERLEVSLCGLDLFGQVLNHGGLLNVLFL